jgi:site-specific DNA-methyltransferase (adenine-specific)
MATEVDKFNKEASRFFYAAKPNKKERITVDGVSHPTVKPLSLMRHLIKLVTPEGGVVLDPFAGSGTTLEAAALEGFDSIGVEMTGEYIPLIEARIARAAEQFAA